MYNWPALIVAPSIALANLSAAYAFVTPACDRNTASVLHAIALLSLVLTALCTSMAFLNLRRMQTTAARTPSDARDRRPQFLSRVAMLVGAFSLIVIVAMWLPEWIVSPCQS